MSHREWALSYCMGKGLSRSKATEVVEAAVANKQKGADYAIQSDWDANVGDFPEQLFTLFIWGLDDAIQAWIELNCQTACYDRVRGVSF